MCEGVRVTTCECVCEGVCQKYGREFDHKPLELEGSMLNYAILC